MCHRSNSTRDGNKWGADRVQKLLFLRSGLPLLHPLKFDCLICHWIFDIRPYFAFRVDRRRPGVLLSYADEMKAP